MNDVPSIIVVSFGFRLRLPLPRFFEELEDFEAVRAPPPPTATGRPTPNRVWVAYAFDVRVRGGS